MGSAQPMSETALAPSGFRSPGADSIGPLRDLYSLRAFTRLVRVGRLGRTSANWSGRLARLADTIRIKVSSSRDWPPSDDAARRRTSSRAAIESDPGRAHHALTHLSTAPGSRPRSAMKRSSDPSDNRHSMSLQSSSRPLGSDVRGGASPPRTAAAVSSCSRVKGAPRSVVPQALTCTG